MMIFMTPQCHMTTMDGSCDSCDMTARGASCDPVTISCSCWLASGNGMNAIWTFIAAMLAIIAGKRNVATRSGILFWRGGTVRELVCAPM